MAGELHAYSIRRGIEKVLSRYPEYTLLDEHSSVPTEDGLYIIPEGDVYSISGVHISNETLLSAVKDYMFDNDIYGMEETILQGNFLKSRRFYYDVVAVKVEHGHVSKYLAIEFNGEQHYVPIWGTEAFARTIVSDSFKSLTKCYFRDLTVLHKTRHGAEIENDIMVMAQHVAG